MGERTAIAWTDHTFNPWIGCTKVSEGCRNCYAEKLVEGRMGLQRWGTAPRVRTKGPWREVLRWNDAAARDQVRRRVFCASLCDVFEDAPGLDEIRADLWPLIARCTSLDWQLLTKRPENIARMLPTAWLLTPRENVWLGTSVESQAMAEVRVPHLMQTPAAVRFLSCEPLLTPLDLRQVPFRPRAKNHHDGSALFVGDEGGADFAWSPRGMLHWVIVGGESGPGHRLMPIEWARDLRQQCREAGVAFFFKQTSGARAGMGADALGELVQEFPRRG